MIIKMHVIKSFLMEDLRTYLFTRYDFRFNLLTEQAEYTPKNETHYQLMDVSDDGSMDEQRNILPIAEEISGSSPKQQR